MSARTLLIRKLRIAQPPLVATRTFVVSAKKYKSLTDAVKNTAKTVDRTVSTAAIKGLEGVEKVNKVAKDAAETVGIKTKQKADELEVEGKSAATKAQVKSEQTKRDAKAGIRDAVDKVKDATR
jgi:hypothetical protein